MNLKRYLPDGKTWIFVLGMALIAFGSSAILYSRSDHRRNADVHPVFHPWALVLGILLVWLSSRENKNSN